MRRDAQPRRCLRSVFEPSSLGEVAEAVAVASEDERRLYVERVDGGYRWSFLHRGGGYPLLRITARFLRVDYTRIRVGFRTVAEGVYVLCADPPKSTKATAWAVVDFDGPTSPEDAGKRIKLALSSVT